MPGSLMRIKEQISAWYTRARDKIAKFSGWIALFTLALTLVAGLQTYILKNQLNEMRDDKRPWVYAPNVTPADLAINDKNAAIMLHYVLENTGKTPARFVNIEGVFLYALLRTDISNRWRSCDELRGKTVVGTAVFPGQKMPFNHAFEMDEADFTKWKQWRPGGPVGAPLIVGCIDYIYTADAGHHQTRFIYELDRAGPSDSFRFIEPIAGIIPAKELTLGVHPGLPKDAD